MASTAALVVAGCSGDVALLPTQDAASAVDAGSDAGAVDVPLALPDRASADTGAVDSGVADAPVGDDASVVDVPAVDAPTVDVPTPDAPVIDAPAVDVPVVDVPAVDVPAVDVPVVDVPAVDVPRDVPVVDVPAVDVPRDVPVVDVPVMDAVVDVPSTDTGPRDTGADVAQADAGVADAGASDSGLVPVRFADVLAAMPDCGLAAGDPRREVVETRCDGLDNDCDGWVDLLLPVAANACSTGAMGVCATGWAACDGTTRVCQAPSATPEVADGRDNDCNGRVDDVATTAAAVRSRALLLVPDDLWVDGPGEVDMVGSILDQWGIAYDRPAVGTPLTSQTASIGAGYALIVIPGYVVGTYGFDTATRTALEAFVRNGGVVVVQKPVNVAGTDLGAFLGLASTARRVDVTTMRFTGDAPATASLDSPEERWLEITENPVTEPLEVYTLTPAASSGAVALAHAYAGTTDVGASVTRRPLGRGSIYAAGLDLHGYRHYRCYINCFEPAGDVLGLFLRDALREGTAGHMVLKHTVPGAEDSLLTLSHDIDAIDSALPGEWGAAGAAQMASIESAHHAHGTYYVATNYIDGYWGPATVRYLCSLGMCPAAAHSVTHRSEAPPIAMGTCTETFATYNPVMTSQTTLCGEVRVSVELLTGVAGARPRLWRSPYLTVNPGLYDLLFANNIVSDSSYAIGDFKTNLPMNLAHTGVSQEIFHHQPIIEHLIAIEDGIGHVSGGVTTREEIQPTNFVHFFNVWTYSALRNAANGGHSMALIHPSAGIAVPQENIGVKMTAADRLLSLAEGAHIRTDVSTEVLADFWRGREGTAVDADFDSSRGYRGTVAVGALPVTGLTLEFGDNVTTFTCDTCGAYRIAGRRVVLTDTLPAGRRSAFTAR